MSTQQEGQENNDQSQDASIADWTDVVYVVMDVACDGVGDNLCGKPNDQGAYHPKHDEWDQQILSVPIVASAKCSRTSIATFQRLLKNEVWKQIKALIDKTQKAKIAYHPSHYWYDQTIQDTNLFGRMIIK